MYKKLIVISLFALILCSCVNNSLPIQVFANCETDCENCVIVTGSSTICIEPDTAILTIGVDSFDVNISVAQTDNSNKMSNIIQLLKENNIEDNKIKTTYLSINQEYDYSNSTRQFQGYRITNQIEFKSKDIANLGELLANLVEIGANILNGIEFTCENYKTLYLESLEDAITNAKEKARILLGNENYTICEIKEINCTYCNYPQICSYKQDLASYSSIKQGEIKIEANIEVTFKF